MKFDIYCGSEPTANQAVAIHALIGRTMKKIGKPFFAHMLVLCGPARDAALAVLSHAGCNVTTVRTETTIKHAIVINGPAPKIFAEHRKQVLVCPED